MKEMTSVATTMMSEEEKAEVEREMNEAAGTPASPPPVSPSPSPAPASPRPFPADSALPSAGATLVPSPARSPSPSSLASPAPGTPGPDRDSIATSSKSPASSSTTNLKDKDVNAPHHHREKDSKETHGKKRSKLTPEQKKKLQELEEERRKNMEERVDTLVKKLVDRLRPFVEAKHPGEKDDPETVAFERKMRREADDMKLESFGVERGSGAASAGWAAGTLWLGGRALVLERIEEIGRFLGSIEQWVFSRLYRTVGRFCAVWNMFAPRVHSENIFRWL